MTRAKVEALPAGVAPRVSVVIPVYNYGRFLEDCVGSALGQPGVDVDVVVVDDSSTDDTREVAQSLAARDPRVRLVAQERNRGHIATFNHALSLATGEFVVKMDADDCLTDGSLTRAAALMTRHPDVAFVYGRSQVFTGSRATTDVPTGVRETWTVWSGRSWLDARLRRGHNPIRQPEVMIRRSSLEQVGGHRVEVPASSDLNLWLRLAAVGGVGRVNGPVQGLYRMHDANMHHTMHGGAMTDLWARWNAFDLFIGELEDDAQRVRMKATLQRTFSRDATRIAETMCDSGVDPTEVEAVLGFAEAMHPARPERVRQALVRSRLALVRGGHVRAARTVPARLKRDLESRVRWQQWDRYGW